MRRLKRRVLCLKCPGSQRLGCSCWYLKVYWQIISADNGCSHKERRRRDSISSEDSRFQNWSHVLSQHCWPRLVKCSLEGVLVTWAAVISPVLSSFLPKSSLFIKRITLVNTNHMCSHPSTMSSLFVPLAEKLDFCRVYWKAHMSQSIC